MGARFGGRSFCYYPMRNSQGAGVPQYAQRSRAESCAMVRPIAN